MQTGASDAKQSNTSASQVSSTSRSPTRKKGVRTGTLSISSRQGGPSKAASRQIQREDQISRKIQELFKGRELTMTACIKQTIFEDRSVYKKNRKEFDSKMQDLEKEKSKIQRRRKNKKEKMKALKANTIERLKIVCAAIRLTYQHYRANYFESDHYRHIKLMEIQANERTKQEQSKAASKKSKAKKEAKAEAPTDEQGHLSPSLTVSGELTQNAHTESTDGAKTIVTESTPAHKKTLPPLAYTGKNFRTQLTKFFESPFKADKQFALQYMAFLTRDKIDESEETVNSLFYRNVSAILMQSTRDPDEIRLKHKAFEILSNMVQSKTHRHKLAHQDYFCKVFDKIAPLADSKESADSRILEKLSWLATLISFHQDMFDQIIKINLLQFVIKISDSSYPSMIRSNAVLAISLLTYNEKLFDQIIEQGVIDLIMSLCKDKNQDVVVKQFSTLALVHFALNRKSIKILIEKGVLNLFDAFGNSGSEQNNEVIQTNVAWIFLALCNNDITGKQMLEQGITRDMFLVSCNPNYQQIRHLVITGFAELGRCIDQPKNDLHYSSIQQRIKETAIVGMHSHLVSDAQRNIDLLITFSTSDNPKFQRTSYWALKDYILLKHDQLIPDVSPVIQAFVNGCLSSEEIIQAECAAGLSFIVTHHLVYESHFNPNISSGRISLPPTQEADDVIERLRTQPVEYVLDAIMYLSGNESKFIRTTAFSTLSSLSKYSSQCPSVMTQIERDIEIPAHLTSKDYLDFLGERLETQKSLFDEKHKDKQAETRCSGLYSLLRLAQEPCEEEIEDATDKYIAFIEQAYDASDEQHTTNEKYFIKVFQALKHTKNPKILRKLLQVIKFYIYQDDSPCQSEIISPHTILWMLEIMEHQRSEKLLCCLTSSTLLNIVSKHEIHFDYQEVAIIKKFNLALQNIDVFDPGADGASANSADGESKVQIELEEGDRSSNRRGGHIETGANKEERRDAIAGDAAESQHQQRIQDLDSGQIKQGGEASKSSKGSRIQEFPGGSDGQMQDDRGSSKVSQKRSKTQQMGEINEEADASSAPKGDNTLLQKAKSTKKNSREQQRASEAGSESPNTQVPSKGAAGSLRSKKTGGQGGGAAVQSDGVSQEISQQNVEITSQKEGTEQARISMSDKAGAAGTNPSGTPGMNMQEDPRHKAKSKQSKNQSRMSEKSPRKSDSAGLVKRSESGPKPESEMVEANDPLAALGNADEASEGQATSEESPLPYRRRPLGLGAGMPDEDLHGLEMTDDHHGQLQRDSQDTDPVAESPSYIDKRRRQKELAERVARAREAGQTDGQTEGTSRRSGPHSKRMQRQGGRESARKISLFKGSNTGTENARRGGNQPPGSDPRADAGSEERRSVDTATLEQIDIEKIDPNDVETIENVLRDSLIKAFMVIFTNEQSQHLLLNKDLIDIAFNCLEFCSECTLEAKRHVARLISIIFKFPQVQERLMAHEVVGGICELLRQTKHTDIIRHTIKACTFISMNYDFIAQHEFSLDILKAMMGLLDQMSTNHDQYNIILTIKNILNGDKQNKLYFLANGGTQKFYEIILATFDVQQIELCVKGIAEQASYKKVMRKVLADEEAVVGLREVIKKCLDLTEDWHHDVNLRDFENAKRLAMGGQSAPGMLEERPTTESAQVLQAQGTKDGELNAQQDITKSQPLAGGDGLGQESENIAYSANGSNAEIPEFMKNDLEQLNLGENVADGTKGEEGFKITRHGRIRDSTYYIVARAIRFGIDTTQLLDDCRLIQRIIKDLSLQNENSFMFQNILLVIGNLTSTRLENDAIVSLVGQNYEIIVDQIYETKDRDRRVSLLKALIDLILKASDKLASHKRLFRKVFEVAKDSRSDEMMIENILWFATALCEDSIFYENFHLLIGNMMSNDIIEIIASALKSDSERIILQALKLLSKLAGVEEFRTELFNRGDILNRIKAISEEAEEIVKYKTEIQTYLCDCLDKITKIGDLEDHPGRTAGSDGQASLQLSSLKRFNKYLIDEALHRPYKLRRLDDPEEPEVDEIDVEQASQETHQLGGRNEEQDEGQAHLDPASYSKVSDRLPESSRSPGPSRGYGVPGGPGLASIPNKELLGFNEAALDDIERFQNANEMVENVVCTLDNIASDVNMQSELIAHGLLDVVARFVQLFLASAKEANDVGVDETVDGIELSVLPTGPLRLIKAIASLMMKLSQDPQVQMQCIDLGMLDLAQTCLAKFFDYEVHTWLYTAIGNFVVSGLNANEPAAKREQYAQFCADIRSRAANAGCVQLLMYGSESSPFFRTRRICSEYLSLL